MLTIEMNLARTAGFSVMFLMVGMRLRKKIDFFNRYSIPAPVIGGVIFSIVHLLLRSMGILEIKFDTSLQSFFQSMYFCTIGLDASFKLLKKGGSLVFRLLILAIIMCFAQNFISIGISNVMNFEPLLGLLCGSSALVGGTGTTAAVAPSIEALGFDSALTVGLTAATVGILTGSLSGGPIGKYLIEKYDLYKEGDVDTFAAEHASDESDEEYSLSSNKVSLMLFLLLIIMFFGSYLTDFINGFVGQYITGVKFPAYLGTMLLASVYRNVMDNRENGFLYMEEVGVVSNFALQLFLGIALLNLKLWMLFDLALPMIAILVAQIIFGILYCTFVCFKVMGSNYDAAMISTGLVGFGMGSTSNAMANLKSLSETYRYSATAFFVVPIIGALFIDFFNIFIIYGFISFLS